MIARLVMSTVSASLFLALSAEAAVYYVDGANGNDSNTGLSESAALRTAERVSSLTLAPGDRVLFRRGQSYSGDLDVDDDGSDANPIVIGAWGSGNAPVLSGMTIRSDYVVVEDLIVDRRKEAADAIRVRGGRNVVLRNLTVRNGTRDGIDAADADGLLVEDVEIHHFLNGSFGSADDAHGVVITGTKGATIRRANIHHVSGDSLQTDPNRAPGNISDDILIEDSTLWTGPLEADFNEGWRTGDSPGENAIDTKVLTSGYENEIRMRIRLVNVTAYGWTAVPQIPNRAAFNLKEKIEAVVDRVTVYDSEIAFRVRGANGNANTTITNTVIYDVDKAIRAEDDVANLKIYHTTFGHDIGQQLQLAGGSGGTGTWDWRNNAFVGQKPTQASDATNLVASASDFVASNERNYALAAGSSLIGKAVSLPGIVSDRTGAQRSAPFDVGAYEHGANAAPPKAPVLTLEL